MELQVQGRMVSETLSERERLHEATGAGRAQLTLHFQGGAAAWNNRCGGESSYAPQYQEGSGYMEQQMRGANSSRYLFRKGAATWSNRCEVQIVSATLSGRGWLHEAKCAAVANAGREWLRGATEVGREWLVQHYQEGGGCMNQQVWGGSCQHLIMKGMSLQELECLHGATGENENELAK